MARDGPELSRREVLGAGASLGLAAHAATSAEVRTSGPAATAKCTVPRIDFVCRDCGGNNVSRDAWADWDVATQDWVLGAPFDDAFCHDCERETRIEVAASQV